MLGLYARMGRAEKQLKNGGWKTKRKVIFQKYEIKHFHLNLREK